MIATKFLLNKILLHVLKFFILKKYKSQIIQTKEKKKG